MSQALLDLPAKRGRLHALAAAGVLDEAELERGLQLIGHRPTSASWSSYLYWNVLITAVVLLAAGTVFFVAANWSAMGPFFRMALVGVPMVAVTLLGGWRGESLAGRALSLLGALLFGPLLAVYGQVYQTGADAWQLFGMWMVVLVAYGVLVRFVGIWMLALLCLHVTCFAWLDQELGYEPYEDTGALIVAGIALLDAGVVALGEWLTKARERVAITHTAAFMGLAILMPFGFLLIFGEGEDSHALGLVVLALALLAIWLVYRWRRPALGMLAAFATVVTILSAALCGRILLDEMDAELYGIALLGVIVSVEVWAFTRWLLRWRREHGEPDAAHEQEEVGHDDR